MKTSVTVFHILLNLQLTLQKEMENIFLEQLCCVFTIANTQNAKKPNNVQQKGKGTVTASKSEKNPELQKRLSKSFNQNASCVTSYKTIY